MDKCEKKRFGKQGVKDALRLAQNSKQPNRKEIRYYLCPLCYAYHLTSETHDVDKRFSKLKL